MNDPTSPPPAPATALPVYRAVLADTKLSSLIEEYEADADPRVVAFSCAFLERNQRVAR